MSRKKMRKMMKHYNSHVPSAIEMPQPEIVIPSLIYEKINFWVNQAGHKECSGLGNTRVYQGKIYVTDVVMVKQKNHGAATDMDDQAITKAMFKLKDVDGNMNFWWHSHASMGVFWSSTDRETIAQIGNKGMCVAAVFNNKREVKAAVACMEPIPFFIDDVKVLLGSSISQELRDKWTKEFNDNVDNYDWSKGWDDKWGKKDKEERAPALPLKPSHVEQEEVPTWDFQSKEYVFKDGTRLTETEYATYRSVTAEDLHA